MANQVLTPNLSLAVPGDDSHNAPWGPNDALFAAALQQLDVLIVTVAQSNAFSFALDTGTANAYAAAFTPAPPAVVGARVYVKCLHANTGASTLAITGFLSGAAKAITKNGTTALSGAEISANQIIQLVWDGTEWQMISQ
jgi:hypothetical protein